VAVGTADPPNGGFRLCNGPSGCDAQASYWVDDLECNMGSGVSNSGLQSMIVPCEGQTTPVALVIDGGVPHVLPLPDFANDFGATIDAVTRFQAPGVTNQGGLTLVGRGDGRLELHRYFQLAGDSLEPQDILVYDGSDQDRFRGVAAGDVDFDGVDDYLMTFRDRNVQIGITGEGSEIQWVTDDASYTGRPRNSLNRHPVADDFNANGRAEFISTEFGTRESLVAAVFENVSPFVHQVNIQDVICRDGDASTRCVFPDGIIAIEVLDADADGLPDLLVATAGDSAGDSEPRIYILRNTGRLP
ncbi:MAG: hypothetical protein ACNA8W_26610, partial [Bradymonadaceae bacterium]